MEGRPTDDVLIRCTRKQGYGYLKARRIARRMRRNSGEPVSEYRCDVCKLWHVGTLEKKHQVRIEKRRGRAERDTVGD